MMLREAVETLVARRLEMGYVGEYVDCHLD